ncbi:MAG: GTPase HflX [Erysipelotrichaceae bacterium]|nr:GTPase HflX [Erysipelotrichaceae bacterium]
MRKAVLAAIKLDNNDDYFDELIEECKNLCLAANIEIINFISQSSRSIDPNYGFRKGKLEELKLLIEETDVDLLVFYNNLPINTVSNLEEHLGVDILDRTQLILDIFSNRARSKEAIIQTEVAKLKYQIPRALKEYTNEDKARGGGFKNKGQGETRANLIKRKMEKRIFDLNEELKDLEKRKSAQTNSRDKSAIKKVALVGYTNAGKSSLMNNLLRLNDKEDKEVYEKDQLFATLDTSVRKIKYKNFEFLLFDTVGFVSDLPHELIEAFKSTLKVAKEADLLLHVLDANNPNIALLRQITNDTLREIEADNIEIIEVYNKIDLLDTRDNNLIQISTKTNEGINNLLDKIINKLYPSDETREVLIPYNKLNVLSQFKSIMNIEKLSDEEEGAKYKISGSEENISKFIKFIKK